MDADTELRQQVDDSRILGGLEQASFNYGGGYQNNEPNFEIEASFQRFEYF
jgi:hypothetical protein